MSYSFSKPTSSAGGFLKPAEHSAHLLLITQVHKIEDRFDSFKGREIPTAWVDYVDLDEDGQELRENVIVSHTGIVNRLAPGQTLILGRIGKATTKSGFEAWVLEEYREGTDDEARAGAWMEQASRISAPKAPAPVQQQAPAPAPAAPAAPAPQATPAMADLNDPAVQELLRSLQQK